MPVQHRLSAGRIIGECLGERLKQILPDAGREGYDFIATYVTHPRCCADVEEMVRKVREESNDAGELVDTKIIEKQLPEITTADILMPSTDWSRLVVGRLSSWIDPDSSDPCVRRLSEAALLQELDYFAYLSLPAVLIRLRKRDNGNLARIIRHYLLEHPTLLFSIWVEVPAIITEDEQSLVTGGGLDEASGGTSERISQRGSQNLSSRGETSDELNRTSTWEWFYRFRLSCDNHRKIYLVLELTPDLPESEDEINRWKGEPLAAVKFNTRTFMSNRSNFPVLSTAHQTLARQFFGLSLQCIVEGPSLHFRRQSTSPGAQEERGCLYYAYLNNLWKSKEVLPNQPLEMVAGYEDYLQSPLQPLGDHLKSAMYEIFEKDSTKYRLYDEAFKAALDAKIQAATPDSPLVVMVLGAGRGPLVQVCYDALKNRSHVDFKLYAVEKNPCAIVTLNAKRTEFWNDKVEVVFSDMRDFHPDQKADVVVSELLGSFGDNELSPECLDGALHLMKDTCISIPTSYRSFISPIHSPKLFNEVRSAAEREYNPVTGYECPYVVCILNHYEIAAAKQLFKFDHPNWDRSVNDRYQELTFIAKESSEMMGVAGYFHATLYGNVSLSIVPKYETPRLFSWFPILFSLHNPVYVEKGGRIRIKFWRCGNKQKVWYEWQLVEPILTPLMNSKGRSYAMNLH